VSARFIVRAVTVMGRGNVPERLGPFSGCSAGGFEGLAEVVG
jgi:hypothetical protein